MTAGTSIDPPPVLAPSVDRADLIDPVIISDLHLGANRPRTLAAFQRFARDVATLHRELLILGDLFDAWAGDDDPGDGTAQAVCESLRALSGKGVRVFLMHGNRDLLLGAGFARQAGAALLTDPTVATITGAPVLLSHGDSWCTRDARYQRFRERSRNPAWQRNFLRLPLALRRAFVVFARRRSERHKHDKGYAIMDVAPETIEAALRSTGLATIIHGHTHRPALNEFLLDGRPARRIVLPDWDFDAAPSRGGYLRFAGGQPVTELL